SDLHNHCRFVVFPLTKPPTANLSPLSLHDALPILTRLRALRLPSAAFRRPARQVSPAISPSLPRTEAALPTPITRAWSTSPAPRSEEHTSELQSRFDLVCRLLLEKKKIRTRTYLTP